MMCNAYIFYTKNTIIANKFSEVGKTYECTVTTERIETTKTKLNKQVKDLHVEGYKHFQNELKKTGMDRKGL